MPNVPPEDLAQLLGQHKVKLVIIGVGGRKALIAESAENVANNDAPRRLAIWIQNAEAAIECVPDPCDLAVLSADNAVVRMESDENPLDLTDPIVLDALFNLGAGA